MSCRHDKRLRFLFYLPANLRLNFVCVTVVVPVVVVFSLFPIKMAVFCISQKCTSSHRSFERLKFLNILSLLFITFSNFGDNAFNVLFDVHRQFRLCQSGELGQLEINRGYLAQ